MNLRQFTSPSADTVFTTKLLDEKVFCDLPLAITPDNKVNGANMGPTWGLRDPGGPHVGNMKLSGTNTESLLSNACRNSIWPERYQDISWHFKSINQSLHLIGMLCSSPAGSDIWGWTDPMTIREYALMGVTGGTSFVDVTDPLRPNVLAFLKTRLVYSPLNISTET